MLISRSRVPSLRVCWRVSCRRLRTYGWSWGAGRLQGWTPWAWSACARMASNRTSGIHPPAGWRRQFSTDPLRGRWTRPSVEGSARAGLRSSQGCVSVQRYQHCPWAGQWPWAVELAWTLDASAPGLTLALYTLPSSGHCGPLSGRAPRTLWPRPPSGTWRPQQPLRCYRSSGTADSRRTRRTWPFGSSPGTCATASSRPTGPSMTPSDGIRRRRPSPTKSTSSRHATPGGGLCHIAPGNGDHHASQGDSRCRGTQGQRVHPLFQHPPAGDGLNLAGGKASSPQ